MQLIDELFVVLFRDQGRFLRVKGCLKLGEVLFEHFYTLLKRTFLDLSHLLDQMVV